MASRREQAGLPTYSELRWVTLQSMRAIPLPATNDEISEAVGDALGLSEVQRSVMHVNGRQTELAYRVGWARSGLKAVGAADSAGRASWMLTSDGRSMSSETIQERHSAYLVAVRRNQEPETPTLDDADDLTPELDWKAQLLNPTRRNVAGRIRAAGRPVVGCGRLSRCEGPRSQRRWRGRLRRHVSPVARIVPDLRPMQALSGAVSAGTVRDFRGAMIGRGDRGLNHYHQWVYARCKIGGDARWSPTD